MFKLLGKAKIMNMKIKETNGNLKRLYDEVKKSKDDNLIMGVNFVIYSYCGIITRLNHRYLDQDLSIIAEDFHWNVMSGKEGLY